MPAEVRHAKTTHELAAILRDAAEYAEECRSELQAAWQDDAAGLCWHRLAVGLERLSRSLSAARRERVLWFFTADNRSSDLNATDTGDAAADQLERIAAAVRIAGTGVTPITTFDRAWTSRVQQSLQRTANATRSAT